MSPDDDSPEDRPEEFPVQPDAADPRQVKKLRVRKKLKARAEQAILRGLLAEPEGRRFLWGILFAAHTFETRFASGGYGFPIEHEIWFQAGAQDLGQRLYQSWDFADHQGVSLMLRENDSRFKTGEG